MREVTGERDALALTKQESEAVIRLHRVTLPQKFGAISAPHKIRDDVVTSLPKIRITAILESCETVALRDNEGTPVPVSFWCCGPRSFWRNPRYVRWSHQYRLQRLDDVANSPKRTFTSGPDNDRVATVLTSRDP